MAGLLSIAFVVGWFFAARWLARRLTSKMKSGPLRSALTWLAVVVFLVLPVADEIIGGFQFRALCKDIAVLKIDAAKIKGKTVFMVSDPANKDAENTVIRIYYSITSFRDTTTQEELARAGRVVAIGGMLIQTLAGGHQMPPLTFPSTCTAPAGHLPLPQEYDFQIDKTQR